MCCGRIVLISWCLKQLCSCIQISFAHLFWRFDDCIGLFSKKQYFIIPFRIKVEKLIQRLPHHGPVCTSGQKILKYYPIDNCFGVINCNRTTCFMCKACCVEPGFPLSCVQRERDVETYVTKDLFPYHKIIGSRCSQLRCVVTD